MWKNEKNSRPPVRFYRKMTTNPSFQFLVFIGQCVGTIKKKEKKDKALQLKIMVLIDVVFPLFPESFSHREKTTFRNNRIIKFRFCGIERHIFSV